MTSATTRDPQVEQELLLEHRRLGPLVRKLTLWATRPSLASSAPWHA